MPLVSVIIPNYNHDLFLKERIESVLNQTYTDFELIILDDHSTDNSRDIVEKYRQHSKVSHIVYNDTNSGFPARQWQKGIQFATGEWIWIAESDDKADVHFLQNAIEILKSHPGIHCYYTDSYLINEKNEILKKASDEKNIFFNTNKWSTHYLAKGIGEINECLKFQCTINNVSAFVFKKNVFTSVQNEVITYQYYCDWFFYIQALLRSDIYYNNNVLSSCRIHLKSFVNKEVPDVETKVEIFRILKFLLSCPDVKQKKELVNFFCQCYLGTGWLKEGMRNTMKLLVNYFKTDRRLALRIISKLLWYKILRKKPASQVLNH